MIAILDDNCDALESTVQSVMALGYEPAGFSHPNDLLQFLAKNPIRLLIIGESTARDLPTMKLLHGYRDQHPTLPVIVLADVECRQVEGFQALVRPFTQSTLDKSISRALLPEREPL
jgi:DNA-binding NtrC family response regulator